MNLRRGLLTAAALLAVAGLAGALAVVSGVIPITASSGHFAVTEWLLVFTKKRSIATHTWGKSGPPLDEPALVLKGAGHFEAGCRPCHGAPDLPRLPRVPRAMLPPPPNLSVVARHYSPEELFYIVKHGIKFTGMPAWPSQVRDDEVGAVVAFLVTLPDLDAEGYRRLVHGEGAAPAAEHERAARESAAHASGASPGTSHDASTTTGSEAAHASASEPLGVLIGAERAPRAVVASCGRCHGMDGLGRGNAAFPALAGQREQYLVASLEAYAADRRQSGIMQPSAAALPADEMREVAAYYSRLPARRARINVDARAGAAPIPDADALERGRSIAERGVPERRIPSCSQCHGPRPGPISAAVPALAGQHADYLVLQLQLLHDEHRGGTERVHLMDEVAPRLTPEQMQDVAKYYESLEPG
ncbi:MAG TPA: c-type cytochrome [Polyangiaceae bacterium]|nr:c-type cytochrome [Polyangiaceae bacterium]